MWGAVVCGDRLSLLLRGALVVTRLRMCSSRVYRALKRSPRQQETASVAALRSIRGPAMSLSGKVAVVTGAAQGLGKAFARVLLKNGTKVALLDVDEDAGAATEAALRDEFGSDATLFLRCDVCSDEEMKNAFQKTLQQFGRLDVVCNNAGIINETNWQKMVDVNLNGVVRGTYLALQHMKKENGGQGGVIINVASMAGLGTIPAVPIYTATKHGVVGFSKALAAASSAAGYGVRINVLCPAFVQTAILSSMQMEETTGQFHSLINMVEKLMNVHGILEVDEVAEALLQLLQDETKNGAVLMMNTKGATYTNLPAAGDSRPAATHSSVVI